jgi:murein DD-endopeptidase MepM/ murein hydrolase activator NlpD
MLPEGLPVRAIADGVVAASHGSGAKELEPGGLMIAHDSGGARVRPVSYWGDVRDRVRAGARVRRGDVVAETLAQAHRDRVPRVVVHFGLALDVPGYGLVFVDPTALLRRWRVRHPVFPGSTCTPGALAAARPGRWRAAGTLEGGVPAARYETSWRSRY